MGDLKVIAFFNQKKCQFSIEALEGVAKGKVIDHVDELILKECSYSKNKSKIAGVIGIWNKTINEHNEAINEYLGGRKYNYHQYIETGKKGYVPTYFGESIEFDMDLNKYVLCDQPTLIELGVSWEVESEVENEFKFSRNEPKKNATLIWLKIIDECEDGDDIIGIAYHWIPESKRSILAKTKTESYWSSLPPGNSW